MSGDKAASPVFNTWTLVVDVMGLLASAGAPCILGGGWAKEARGMITPRPHRDIDLFYVAENFSLIDSIIQDEIEAKRSDRKRAFLIEGVMVEITLTPRCGQWVPEVGPPVDGIPTLSESALRSYQSPCRVAEVLQVYARYLAGNGPAPDIDTLDDTTRDRVDDLLPAIVEMFGDNIADHSTQVNTDSPVSP